MVKKTKDKQKTTKRKQLKEPKPPDQLDSNMCVKITALPIIPGQCSFRLQNTHTHKGITNRLNFKMCVSFFVPIAHISPERYGVREGGKW